MGVAHRKHQKRHYRAQKRPNKRQPNEQFPTFGPSLENELMLPAYSLNQVLHEIAKAFRSRDQEEEGERVRMVGLLFAPPGTAISKAEILPRLNDFHHRSGNNIDFFCAGYGAYWPESWAPDAQPVATTADPRFGYKTDWFYSAKHFNDFRNEIKSKAKSWNYSGEVDLVLLNAHPDTYELAKLNFTRAVVLRVDQLKKDKLIESAPVLFEKICSYADGQRGDDPTWGFSDEMGLKVGRSWFVDLVQSKLLLKTGQLWKKGSHYAVLNLTQ